MQMEKGLDTGPVLLAQALDIGADETGGQLHDRLSELGARVLADGLGLLRASIRLPRAPAAGRRRDLRAQDRQGRGAAGLVAGRRACWRNKVRAFNPWPMAEAQLDGERVRIHGAIALDEAHDAAPGSLLARRPRRHRHRLRRGRAADPGLAARWRQGDHRRGLRSTAGS